MIDVTSVTRKQSPKESYNSSGKGPGMRAISRRRKRKRLK